MCLKLFLPCEGVVPLPVASSTLSTNEERKGCNCGCLSFIPRLKDGGFQKGTIMSVMQSDTAMNARANVAAIVCLSCLTSLNGVVYVATTHDQVRPDNSTYESSGSLYAVRASDGKQLWRYHAQGGVFSPLALNGMALVSVSQMDGVHHHKVLWRSI